MKLSHYEVLGLKTDCSQKDIKKAYKEKLVNTHPDKVRSNDVKRLGIATINDIQDAYKILGDENLRAAYDIDLLEGHKKQGYHNSGDGLDEYSLDEFYFNPAMMQYCMDCPRCKAKEGFHFSEDTLEEYAEEKPTGFQVLAQCSACSLWLKVNFDVIEEYE